MKFLDFAEITMDDEYRLETSSKHDKLYHRGFTPYGPLTLDKLKFGAGVQITPINLATIFGKITVIS